MREASESRTVTDTDSYAFFILTNIIPNERKTAGRSSRMIDFIGINSGESIGGNMLREASIPYVSAFTADLSIDPQNLIVENATHNMAVLLNEDIIIFGGNNLIPSRVIGRLSASRQCLPNSNAYTIPTPKIFSYRDSLFFNQSG